MQCAQTFGLILVFCAFTSPSWLMGRPESRSHRRQPAILIGDQATPLERHAATELQRYLRALFRVEAVISSRLVPDAEAVIVMGTGQTHPLLWKLLPSQTLNGLNSQGFLIRRVSYQSGQALIIAGGSPQAVLWGIYDYVERHGVRYLLRGDTLPENSGKFQLLDLDVLQEPLFVNRVWRAWNALPIGPEMWGLGEYRNLIDQLAKMKYNGLFLATWPWQPVVDYQIDGIQRSTAELSFGARFPIRSDTVGRLLFGGQAEFTNPEFIGKSTYRERIDTGRRLLHSILAHANARGMSTWLSFSGTEFPPEFRPLMKDPKVPKQVGALTVAEGDIQSDNAVRLSSRLVKAYIDEYPEVDHYIVIMPEFRDGNGPLQKAWRSLDQKYHLGSTASLEELIQSAQRRTWYPGGSERAVNEVKGDILTLEFLERLFGEHGALKKTRKPDADILLANLAVELLPLQSKIQLLGRESLNFIDYTADRVAAHPQAFQLGIPAASANLILTLADDNVGVFHQVSTPSVHTILQNLRQNHWKGYFTRYWIPGDLEFVNAYLAEASWDENTTPDSSYRRLIGNLCGEAAIPEMLKGLDALGKTTVLLGEHALGLGFPVRGGIGSWWKAGKPLSPELGEIRLGYNIALEAIRSARQHSKPSGAKFLDYHLGRISFSLQFLNVVEAVGQAGRRYSEAKSLRSENATKTAGIAASWALLEHASQLVHRALETQAAIVRDRSDLGVLASMNVYLKSDLEDLLTKLRNEATVDSTRENGRRKSEPASQ